MEDLKKSVTRTKKYLDEEKTRTELWWLLWGIAVAFLVQVTYDSFGLSFNKQTQVTLGFALSSGMLIVLGIYAYFRFYRIKKLTNELAKETENAIEELKLKVEKLEKAKEVDKKSKR